MNNLLVACNLHKGYESGNQRLQVLVDLSLEIPEGEMVAVTGASGSGKSTLLHLLGGMDAPDRGSIQIHGTDIVGLNALDLAGFRNRTIGFLFQFHHLLPEFTAVENVMMPLLLRGAARFEAERSGRLLLEEVALGDRAHHRPGQLSGGEQQRVALARALVGRPRLLLADEPTGNLDPHTGDAIGRLIRSMHSSHGLTSILATHNERLAQSCSRVYRLEDGRLTVA